MKYCTNCLYPENHALNITFDSNGVCSGCRVHEEKDNIDWNARQTKLKSILEASKKKAQSNYDCVIPVSGGRDSFFIVDLIKRVYGLNPLLVTYNKHYNTSAGISNITLLRTVMDCDIATLTLNPFLLKKITRHTLSSFGSIYWHCLAGQTVYPVRVAVGYKIPLIIWGAHQGCDQVGMYSHLDEVEMTRKYRKEHDLMGYEAEDLVDKAPDLKEKDLQCLFYPHDKEIEAVGVRGIYLSNYIRWDSIAQHNAMHKKYGYLRLKQQRTFDDFNDADCQHYSGLHDYIKLLKHGYGKVSDHASREIRLRSMTRTQAVELVPRYNCQQPEDLGAFADWLGLSPEALLNELEKFRNANLWEKVSGGWKLKYCVTGKPLELANFKPAPQNNQYHMLTKGLCDRHNEFFT